MATIGQILAKKKKKPTVKSTSSRDRNFDYLERKITESGHQCAREHIGVQGRRWRFDMTIPELKIAIEYEGINSKKSRHTSAVGYTGDTEKYNEATIQGWRILRYTAINIDRAWKDIQRLITAGQEMR
jgi:hypothetical protein